MAGSEIAAWRGRREGCLDQVNVINMQTCARGRSREASRGEVGTERGEGLVDKDGKGEIRLRME